jgi:hypothetical protein
VEDHDQVDVEFDLEILVHEGWARVYLGKEHVQGDLQFGDNVAVCYLDVLDFRRRLALSVVLFFVGEGFDANQLDFDRLDLDFRLTTD